MTLYDFINGHKNDILTLAREKILARNWPTVSPMELEHGLPLFLSQLSESYGCGPAPSRSPAQRSGAALASTAARRALEELQRRATRS